MTESTPPSDSNRPSDATPGADTAPGRDVTATGNQPTTGSGLRVAYAVGRAELHRYGHRYVASRRKKALMLLAGVALLPIVGVILLLAHAAGESVASGGLRDLPHVARWWLPLVMAIGALNGAFMTTHLLDFGARKLLLATVPDRTLALGLLAATCWTVGLSAAIPVALVFAAFGLGAGSATAAVVGAVAALCIATASYLVGVTGGLLARAAFLRVPMTSDARELYGTVLKVGLFVGMGAVGAVAGSTLGDLEDEELSLSLLAPSEPTPVPLGHAADWLFVATPLVDGPSTTALAAGLVVLALVPLSVAVILRLTPRLWYADPARPESMADGDDGSPTPTEETALPSFLSGGRFPKLGRTGVVLDGLVRRARRQPTRFAFLGYYLFLPVTIVASTVPTGQLPAATAFGAGLVILGLWLAGGAFCLNPLGEEGTMLGQLVLSDFEARTFVRARLLAGVLVGAPLVAVGTALLGVEALTARQTLALGTFWLALVPASAGLALGIGTLLPSTETRELLDAVTVRAPETLAIVYHAGLVLVLARGGHLLVTADLDPLLAGGVAAALATVLVVAGHGGYRFALGGLADHGRERRPDPVFAVELGVGLAVAGAALSFTAGLGVAILVDAAGTVGLAVDFLAQYAGYLTVVVAYLLVSGRRDYPDLSLPTAGDLRTVAVVTAGLLALWAAASAAVELLDLPATSHALAGSGEEGLLAVAVTVALVLAVVAPVEELLFRNVVQKRLGEALDRRGALLVATVVFGLVHVPAYAGGGLPGAVVPLTLVTVAGGGFAVVYDRTGTVLAPALSHGLYNAVQILAGAAVLG